MEIIGFWTPEYLEAKQKTLREFCEKPIVLAVADSLHRSLPGSFPDAIRFKSALKIADVLERLKGQ